MFVLGDNIFYGMGFVLGFLGVEVFDGGVIFVY